MSSITLAQADQLADEALKVGRQKAFAPLTVAILDTGGHLKVLKREEGAGILRPQIAIGKAWGALGMGFGGRELARRAQAVPHFFTAIDIASEGRMVPVAGGALLCSADGTLMGAIGISGDTSDNDEVCILTAAKTVGVVAETGDPVA
ncbi:GlcG/HbpS family heme-binding protein [Piscinibacter sakaiensis]|uniref:GlcG/HbpS family heme-binding protein n=1 Tax=Piscinibacter sakaiensis TaxID=1547922 RepID=UPI003AB0B1CC